MILEALQSEIIQIRALFTELKNSKNPGIQPTYNMVVK